MTPKGARPSSGWPVVLMLSGFTGNGLQTFNIKTFETGSPDILDRALGNGEAPRAMFVFCDAMTSWGGSQFIDSEGMGRYASYVLDEICPALILKCHATEDSNFWCVMGGSSGGYGALQLSTLRQGEARRFGTAVAIAPDSFFEASLLPELRTALPLIKKMGGVEKVREEVKAGKLSRRKEWHVILNAVAMGLCYAPLKNGEPIWPIDLDSGLVREDVWREWLKHDPLKFLGERAAAAKSVRFYLDVGDRDQFQLQYGTRQIRDLLKNNGCDVHYVGFEGTHFDIGDRRLPAWTWLAQFWRV
jgi:S-formylglutathione hydrolase FrmB